jgi:hypothetical protein
VADRGDKGRQRWPRGQVDGGLVTGVPCIGGGGGWRPMLRAAEPAAARSVERGSSEKAMAMGQQLWGLLGVVEARR